MITFGLVVLFSGCIGQQGGTPTPTLTPTPTPTVTVAPTVTQTALPEVTPTGNQTAVRVDSNRGFIPSVVAIQPGDEIVWNNYNTDTVTLVSGDNLFDAQSLAYYQRYQYIFNKSGTYTFYLGQNKNLNGTVIVQAQAIPTATLLPSTANLLPPGTLYVDAQIVRPSIWGVNRFEVTSWRVRVYNQGTAPLSITAQVVNDGQVLEEDAFTLQSEGSSYSFTNEKTHFINNTNVTLQLLIPGYQPAEYNFTEVTSIG